MEQVSFIDPFAADKRPEVSPSKNFRAVPVPPQKPVKASEAVPSRGREREVQQLIHDLAVLAAESKPPV